MRHNARQWQPLTIKHLFPFSFPYCFGFMVVAFRNFGLKLPIQMILALPARHQVSALKQSPWPHMNIHSLHNAIWLAICLLIVPSIVSVCVCLVEFSLQISMCKMLLAQTRNPNRYPYAMTGIRTQHTIHRESDIKFAVNVNGEYTSELSKFT